MKELRKESGVRVRIRGLASRESRFRLRFRERERERVVVSWWEKRRRGRMEWEELGRGELRGKMWRSKRSSCEIREESMAANLRDSMMMEKGNLGERKPRCLCFFCIVSERIKVWFLLNSGGKLYSQLN